MDSGGVGLFVVLFIIGWLVCGFVAGAVWESKGGSFGAGFALGAFLGYLGLFYVAFARPEGQADGVASAPPAGTYKTCPRCAEEVREAAKVCRFCGYEFAESAPAPVATSSAHEELDGVEVRDVTPHALGVLWGRDQEGALVYKPKEAGQWLRYEEGSTPFVPPRALRSARP